MQTPSKNNLFTVETVNKLYKEYSLINSCNGV